MGGGVVLVGFVNGVAVGVGGDVVFREHEVALVVLEHLDASRCCRILSIAACTINGGLDTSSISGEYMPGKSQTHLS